MRISTPRLLLLLTALGVAVGGAWLTLRPLEVVVVAPVRGPAIDAIYATGTVEPTVMLPVAPRVAGRLVALETDEGRSVKQGEVLARLDSADLDATLDELNARARYAREQLTRVRDLVKRGVAAANELDRVRADADAAQAALKRARAQRDFNLLVAPADGEIIRRDGEVGQFLSAGQAVFVMRCCAPLRVTADVDEEDIPRVHVGQKVVLRADALPGRTFDGEVADVTPKGDPVARSYRVRITLADPAALQVGMTVDANLIVSERQDALLVPATAIEQGAVWVLRDGRLARQPVKTGIVGLSRIEVVEGLAADDRVVEVAGDALREGRRARGIATTAPAQAPDGTPP